MNSKRQTIWLVSMLSLMVVLSAYYLFTEDVSKLEFTSTGAPINGSAKGAEGTNGLSAKEIVINTNDLNVKPVESKATPQAAAKTDTKASTPAAVDTKQQTSAAAPSAGTNATPANSSTPAVPTAKAPTPAAAVTDPKNTSKATAANTQTTSKANETVSAADAKVLQQVMTQVKSGSDYFAGLGLKRNEEMAKLTEKWMTILADPKQSATAAANAEAELRKLQDQEAKVTNLEDTLMKEFPQAVITEEASKWRVTVQSNKLEKSQAVSIIDKVMQEMNVGADKIVVQFVP
ncbi:stage III sporulation protein AH [Paenibacillus sp. 1_12]|uniref:SpoIIIAH-like family protein n=1 Tax=Paenibacillus sp. 1_12 TaxID=1566278 RepID=UPI0008E05F8A|nr:SpoIIIAH-like family protein [Paenibacillus sp. 1_12]SFK93879.1 stage III sporulation protein AH [Paenibacillus sp. 1_12]